MSSKLFELVSNPNVPRSNFDLVHDHKTTMNFGTLCPLMCIEAVPGDVFNISHEALIRLAPMLAPVMHNMTFKAHSFFVPTRLLWDNFEEYYAKTDNTPGVPHVFPYVEISNANWTRLHDYIGLPRPAVATGNVKITATQLAAYQCIYDNYYRDQNLITTLGDKYWKLVNGDNDANTELKEMRNVSWMHDYLTSCLPTPQKGDPALLSIANMPDLPLLASDLYWPGGGNQLTWTVAPSGGGPTNATIDVGTAGINAEMYVPLSTVNATVPIDEFREAYKTQEWLERAMRGGSRFIEVIRSHFNVKSSDARFQRPEYICGIQTPIIVSEVLQTGETADTPQGNMAGHGVSAGSSSSSKFFVEEPGYILTIAFCTARTAYQNGVDKQFLKYNDNFEFYWPEFAQLSEQAVYNREVHIDHAQPDGVFGYIPRYAEYKFVNSRVSADFRAGEPLSFWHLGRELATTVALNKTFIELTPEDTERIFAVQDGTDPIYLHLLNRVYASRLMPYYGDPLQL